MEAHTEYTQNIRPNILETILTAIDIEQKIFLGVLKADPSVNITVRYSSGPCLPCFSRQLEEAAKYLKIPFQVNLLDATHGSDGILNSSSLILLPEYLVDVTSISGCFTSKDPVPEAYITEKFKERNSNISTLAGNIINIMTDQMIQFPEITFRGILRSAFQWFPIELSFLSDAETAQLVQLIKPQFLNLLKTIHTDFPKFGIEIGAMSIEPSFYSRTFGIQGRLDLLYPGTQETPSHIIEVKSGKIYQPNPQGINQSHYIQTVLYDLLIRSVYHPRHDPYAYILYSRDQTKPMRMAEVTKSSIYQSLWIRNAMVLLDYRMTNHDQIESIISEIALTGNTMENSFLKSNMVQLSEAYHALSELEKVYFNYQCAFISNEKLLTKSMHAEYLNGNPSHHDKTSYPNGTQFTDTRKSFLNRLTILENKANQADPILILDKCQCSQDFSNLKAGELVILYPSGKKYLPEAIYDNQVYKCTIWSIQGNQIYLKLRKPQHNLTLFENHDYWTLITEYPENGYQAMYQNLSEWTYASKDYRDLILGKRPPYILQEKIISEIPSTLTETQQKIFRSALHGYEYYLIWGPPGTGKTQIILRAITEYLIKHTSGNVILLAYTNRAVDEICGSLLANASAYSDSLIRIGSRQATSVHYHGYLFDSFIRKCSTRQEVRQILQKKRIYTATISSISNKRELLRHVSFDTVIIDEASQIPESMLCGLLHHFKKIILIGDHRQLPAVIIQPEKDARLDCSDLLSLGIDNLRNSLFERLFRKARKMGWDHAYGLLSEQGRMHTKLMDFANSEFYENQLMPFPGLNRQVVPIFLKNGPCQQIDLEKRKLFLHIVNTKKQEYKTNVAEAEICAELIKILRDMYRDNKKDLHKESIGIITPFRAQSILIYQTLLQKCPDLVDLITIDTVERYQGSARDIIILSSCVSQTDQLSLITSVSSEGIDRKLNVATTRAREQLILLGNRNILEANASYKKLIAWMEKESIV